MEINNHINLIILSNSSKNPKNPKKFLHNTIILKIKGQQMRHKTLLSLVFLGCVSLLHAQNEVSIENFDREVSIKQSNAKHLDELLITISIKTKETMVEGNKALKSLQSNLKFIERVATDKNFRSCIVAKEYKKDILANEETAKSMLQEKKITQEQYNNYKAKNSSSLESLNSKISKLCTKGE